MSQRERYDQGGIGRWYWDYRDRAIVNQIMYVKRNSINKHDSINILDVGCGDGITTKKAGAIGLDLDRGDVKGSVYDLPFRAGSFGTVLLMEVIEHLERPEKAIAEINRVLKPGGKLIMVFPNDLVFKIAWFLCLMWGEIFKDRGHLRKWTPWLAIVVFQACGFKVTKNRSIPFKFWPFSLHHIIVGEKC